MAKNKKHKIKSNTGCVEHHRGEIQDNALKALVTSQLFRSKVEKAKKVERRNAIIERQKPKDDIVKHIETEVRGVSAETSNSDSPVRSGKKAAKKAAPKKAATKKKAAKKG